MHSSLGFKITLFLAFLQGVAGLLRAYDWVKIGVDVFGQGLLILPFVGMVAVARGLFISGVALLYLLSVIGALRAKTWAWWTCFTAVVLNLLLVLGGIAEGAPVIEAVAWSVIPITLLFFLFFGTRRKLVKNA